LILDAEKTKELLNKKQESTLEPGAWNFLRSVSISLFQLVNPDLYLKCVDCMSDWTWAQSSKARHVLYCPRVLTYLALGLGLVRVKHTRGMLFRGLIRMAVQLIRVAN
jgi:hypothetical protein